MSGVEVGVALSNVDHGGGQRDRRSRHPCGELYASGGEVLPAGQAGSEDAAGEGGGGRRLGDSAGASCVCVSREQFESLVSFLDGSGRCRPVARGA